MPLGRSAAHKICVSALELATTLISNKSIKLSAGGGVLNSLAINLKLKTKHF